MIGEIKKGDSSCTMEGLYATLVAERKNRQIAMFLKLDKGNFPLARINADEGKVLREKEKSLGMSPQSVPGFWWCESGDVLEVWPRACRDYTIIGVHPQ